MEGRWGQTVAWWGLGGQLVFVKKTKMQHTSPSSAHSHPAVTYQDLCLGNPRSKLLTPWPPASSPCDPGLELSKAAKRGKLRSSSLNDCFQEAKSR